MASGDGGEVKPPDELTARLVAYAAEVGAA